MRSNESAQQTPVPLTALPFDEGGGAMGALMRAHDWSTSPLGPPELWPQPLRSVVSLLLMSKFPMFVAWGDKLGFLYNDAYAEILGDKHPKALGGRFFDIWREIWPDIEPLITGAMRGEASYRENLPLLLNRHGYEEQAWFTFSYSPVRDERGVVAGMFCAVVETTATVLGRKRDAFRLALGERLHALDDPKEMTFAACEALGRELGVSRVGYGELNATQTFLTVEEDWTDGRVPSVAGRHRQSDFGSTALDLEAGRIVAIDFVRNDPRVGPEAAAAFEAIQVRAALAVPLIRNGRLTALLYLHHREPRRWRPEEIELCREVADRTRAAVERGRAEAQLRSSENRFRALATAGSYSLYRMSADWSEIRQLDGKGFLADVERPMQDWAAAYIPPEDRARVEEAIREAVRTRSTYELEHRVRRADGTPGWALSRAVPIFDPGGAIEEWFGAATDVTPRRAAEERMREAEQQLRATVENLPELAWTAQPDGASDFFNRRWYEYTGATFEQARGWGWTKVHESRVLPTVLDRWQHSLATGQTFEMEYPLRGADGVFRWFLSRVQPMRNDRGEIVRWIGISTNVDEQRRQAAELKQAVELRDTFLSVAGHELRTPLTPMALRVQSIARAVEQQQDSPFVRQVRAYTDSAKRQIDKLSALVNDLLDVSRISSGRFRIELEPVDLAAIARDVVARYEPEAQRAGSAIELRVVDGMPTVSDKLRVEQVITNLVDNAIKYGAGKPIEVVLERVENVARLTVRDRGIGIAPEHASRIFERFERAVSERNYGGLGLGLYISRTIVESLGGTISVQSAPGAGATFTMELPLRPPER